MIFKHTLVLSNKSTTTAMSSVCGSQRSLLTPYCWRTDCITSRGSCYIGTHWIKHVHNFYSVHAWQIRLVWHIKLPRMQFLWV